MRIRRWRQRRISVRIAFVVHDFNRVFGHSRYVAELASRFAGDHEVHVFSNTFADLDRGIVPHRVPALRATALTTILSFYPAATVRLGGGFDIVHAQGFAVAGANVITAHISNACWMRARRHLLGGRLPWTERVFGAAVIPLERLALQSRRATVIAISNALARDLESTYGRRSGTVVIHHGVDHRQFNPAVRERHRDAMRLELGCAGDQDVLFLFVGDLRKGFAQAIAALGPSGGRLLGVSRSDPAEALALADRHGVADRVQVHPPSSHIERYYAAADAFVFPTPYDAFGMVVTEAMACGLPVVTTRAAGAAELIDHDQTGLLVDDPTDISAFTTHMRALAADPSRRRRLGEAAAAAMRTQSWDSVAERTMTLYERVVSTRLAVAPSLSS